jgi:hypothetical protein
MKSSGRSTKINQYAMDGKFIREWKSIRDAAKSFGFTNQTISNNLRGVRKSAHGFMWKYSKTEDLEDEFWECYPLDERFMVSNRGRIRTPTGKISVGCNVGNYRRIRTSGTSTSIHRMVAITFIEQIVGCNIVNHIDHNPQNNYLENLEWVDHPGNMAAAEKFYRQ